MTSQATGQTSHKGTTVFSLKIERAVLESFREVAAANERTMSQELRWMIDQRVGENAA